MTEEGKCYLPREAVVAHRHFDTPTWIPQGLPTRGSPSMVPVANGARLYTWGDENGPPRQWWVRLSGTALQATVAGPVGKATPLGVSVALPHAVFTRAQLNLGNDLLLTHDWRGVVLTPPLRSLTLIMLGLRDAMSARIDGDGVLASAGGDDAVTIDSVTALAWRASRDDGALDSEGAARALQWVKQRQSRGRQSVRVTDTYEVSSAVNITNLWLPLMPWAQRARVWAFSTVGAGTVFMQLIASARDNTSIVAQWSPLVDNPPWIEVTQAVGIRPAFSGPTTTWRFRVEQEVYT